MPIYRLGYNLDIFQPDTEENMTLADSFLFQGMKHEICEDYVLHGNDYFVLSDGCSNGGVRVDTDFGARFICKAAEQSRHLAELKPDLFLEATMTSADRSRMSLGLQPESLAATLLMGLRTKTSHRYFFCGDGFYGGRTRDGVWHIHKVEFTSFYLDRPPINFYPSYILDPALMTKFFEEERGRYHLDTSVGKFGEGIRVVEAATVRLDETSPYILVDFPIEDYDITFAASDGLGSFTTLIKKCVTSVDYLKVMGVIFDFVQYGPEFLRHQCNWCFKQNKKGTFPNLGWRNSDDVAIGILYEPSE